jgi:hypothetical protein
MCRDDLHGAAEIIATRRSLANDAFVDLAGGEVIPQLIFTSVKRS